MVVIQAKSCSPLLGGTSIRVTYRSLFLNVVTSLFMDSADSVTSSSSRCSRRRPACARDASSSASSSCLLSCFSRRLLFSSCEGGDGRTDDGPCYSLVSPSA